MHVDIHGYDTRSAENMDRYIAPLHCFGKSSSLISTCMLIYMGMIQGALRIWIDIYRGAPRRLIKEVFCTRVVHYGISSHRGSKNLRL